MPFVGPNWLGGRTPLHSTEWITNKIAVACGGSLMPGAKFLFLPKCTYPAKISDDFYWFRQKFSQDLSDPPGFHNFCWPSFTDLQKFPQDLSDAPRVFKFLMTFLLVYTNFSLVFRIPRGNLRTPICTPLEYSSWTPTYIESVSIIMLSIIPCRVCCRIRRTLTIRTGRNQSFWDPRTKQHHWPTRFIGSIAQLSLPTVDNREKAPRSCSNGLQQFNSAACRGTLAVSDL